MLQKILQKTSRKNTFKEYRPKNLKKKKLRDPTTKYLNSKKLRLPHKRAASLKINFRRCFVLNPSFAVNNKTRLHKRERRSEQYLELCFSMTWQPGFKLFQKHKRETAGDVTGFWHRNMLMSGKLWNWKWVAEYHAIHKSKQRFKWNALRGQEINRFSMSWRLPRSIDRTPSHLDCQVID